MAISALGIAVIAESYFDKDQENDSSLCILALPISLILISQSLMDFQFSYQTKSKKDRVFYNLDDPIKKVMNVSNIGATIIYCICLFRWLWIIETNEHNNLGTKQDAKAVNLALVSLIFYCLFLIEKVGSYILNVIH